jgi:hypothetical protein
MVADAFFYLTTRSFLNRIRVRLRRLKEPRYLIGLVAGLLYMWTFVFRNLFRGSAPGAAGGRGALTAMMQTAGPVVAIGSVVLFIFTALSWMWPGRRPALTFTRPEVQFLFQAPLTRRQLVHYRLIRSQIGTIFSSVITTLLLRPGSLAMGWTTVVGMWLMFSIISLHTIGLTLSQQSVRKAGLIGLAKQWVPFTILVGAILVLLGTVAMDWTHLASLATPREVVTEIQRLATTGAAGIVLWPFRAILSVPLSGNAHDFWLAVPWALLILALNYVWVLQADAAFEEASVARSEQVAARLAAVRSGRLSSPTVRKRSLGSVFGSANRAAGAVSSSATPFSLALTGRPETAILWKNLIMVGRYLSLKTLWRVLPLLVAFLIFTSQAHSTGWLPVVGMLCLVFLGFTIILGPQMARNDLRQDLAQLGVLKTWPVSGAELLRGELLAPAVVLTTIAWFLTIGAAMLLGTLDIRLFRSITLLNRLSYAIAAMLVAPGLILSQLVVQNGIAIMFPAWVSVGGARARGIEATGQRLLMMAGNIVTLVLALLPGLLVGGIVGAIVYWQTGVVLVLLPALIVSAFMIAECWLAIEGLGRALERTDVSAVGTSE